MNLLDNIDEKKTIKLKGVRFVIRKLTPFLFLDKEYMLPISNIMEINNKVNTDKDSAETLAKSKDRIKDILLKGIVCIKILFIKNPIEKHIDKIMEQPILYTYLVTQIINHTLSFKKKTLK
jgi:hypothetical protein